MVGRTVSQVRCPGAHQAAVGIVTVTRWPSSSLQASLQVCAARRGRRISAGSSPEDTPMDAEAGVPEALASGEGVVGARADDGPSAEAPASTGKVDTLTILKGLVGVVRRHGWALVTIYLLTEAVNFLTNRAFHRLTNQIAMTSLAVPAEAIGNVWWLSQNPELLANGSSYQALTASVFLVAFPVSVLIKAIQNAYFYYVLCNDCGDLGADGATSKAGDDVRIPRPENAFRPAIAWTRSQFGNVRAMAPSLFTVEFLVSLVVIPLQFASLLVFSLPFTLPIIMSVHVALPVAISRKIKGWKAIQASRKLMKPILWQAAIPFVLIIVLQRMIDLAQGKIIASLPSRFYYELLEIPLGILALGFSLSVVASVMRSSLPFLLFNMLERDAQRQGS